MSSVIINNKAVIRLHSSSVLKFYVERERNLLEYDLLLKVHSIFGDPIQIENCTYGFVRPISASIDRGILMDRVFGSSCQDIYESKPECLYHAGVWLALFHKKTYKTGRVKCFYDFSMSNIFISDADGVLKIYAIDPGPRALILLPYYHDLFAFITSYIICEISKFKIPKKALLDKFITGYCKHFSPEYSSVSAKKISLAYVDSMFFSLKSKKRRHPVLIVLGLMFIKLYYLLFVLRWIKTHNWS